MWQFMLFRGLQGLGGGAFFPVALAVVADLYTPAERGKYAGYFGAVFGLSSLLGPAIGGIITDNFGWHWIFFVNVPLGLISLFVLCRLLPATKPDTSATQHRLRRRGALHGCDRAVPHRPEQQAEPRNPVDRSMGRRPDAHRAAVPGRLHLLGIRVSQSRSSRSTCSATGRSPSR